MSALLTQEERARVAGYLLARARHKARNLSRAQSKPVHPELLNSLRADVAECTRLASKLLGDGSTDAVAP